MAMCGRFALMAEPENVAEAFGLMELDGFPPRFNIAPTQPVLVVIAAERPLPGSNQPDRRALLVRWGLTPAWVKDPADFPLLINARSETVADKASFKAALRHRRVLIPASGFYEWHRQPKNSGAASQAYWIRPKTGGLVAFAGLMETWSSPDGSKVDTGAILTTRANGVIGALHDRIPVVISPENFARWLDCRTQEPRDIADLLAPADESLFEVIAVSDKVNKVANMGPDLQVPIERPAVSRPDRSAEPPQTRQLSLF